jgi:hypothetical protein
MFKTELHRKLRMCTAIALASQLHFLANKHAVLVGCSAHYASKRHILHKK